MTINFSNVSKRIFDVLTGTNREFIMGDSDSVKTLDPNTATRFYVKDLHSLIFIDNVNSEIQFNASNLADTEKLENLKNAIQKTAQHYMLKFNAKTFGKKLEPKNFAFMNVEESFSPMSGSTKSSYQKVGSGTRLIIRHTKAVNEEVRGARSRSIRAIYIENVQGERFQFPMRWLTGARSMAKHIAEGGLPYDDTGKKILGLCEQYASLRKFVRHANGQGFINEDTQDLVEMANTRSEEILRAIRTNKFESVKYEMFTLSEDDDVSSIRDKFTRHTINQAVENATPYLYHMIKEREQTEHGSEALHNLVDMVDKQSEFTIKDLDQNDPENPLNLTFNDSEAKIKHLAKYVSDHLEDQSHKDTVVKAAEHYGRLDVEQKNQFHGAIRNLIRKTNSVNTEQTENYSLDEDAFSLVKQISKSFTVESILTKR